MHMKRLLLSSFAAMAGLALLGLAGCSKSGGNIDTSRVQSAFQNAPPVDKAEVQNAIAAVKASDYPTALASLQKVVTSANITPEQKSAVQDLVSQVKTKGLGGAMGGTGQLTNQMNQGADKAAQDSQKPFKQ